MEALKPSSFLPVRWSLPVELFISGAAGAGLASIREEVQSGAAEVYAVKGRGLIVTRLELGGVRPFFVVVAGAGKDARGVVRYLVELCRVRGWSFRFHTQHKGLVRLVGCDLVPAGVGPDGYKIFVSR